MQATHLPNELVQFTHVTHKGGYRIAIAPYIHTGYHVLLPLLGGPVDQGPDPAATNESLNDPTYNGGNGCRLPCQSSGNVDQGFCCDTVFLPHIDHVNIFG